MLCAFVTEYRGDILAIVNVTNPAAPTVVGSFGSIGAPDYMEEARGVKVV